MHRESISTPPTGIEREYTYLAFLEECIGNLVSYERQDEILELTINIQRSHPVTFGIPLHEIDHRSKDLVLDRKIHILRLEKSHHIFQPDPGVKTE